MTQHHTWTADLIPTDDGQPNSNGDIPVFVFTGSEHGDDRKDIATIHNWHGPKARDKAARLIAASPELLAALETMLAVHERPWEFPSNGHHRKAVEAALAAIAKATT